MSDAGGLLAILVTIYIVDCVLFARWEASVLIAPLPGLWRLVNPGSWLAFRSGGAVLANPLPPLGRFVLCQPIPLSLSPEGVLAFSALAPVGGRRRAQSGIFVRFDAIERVHNNERVLEINGQPMATLATRKATTELARLIERLRALPEEERGAAIEEAITRSLDESSAGERWMAFRDASRMLLIWCNLFGLLFFGLIPALFWTPLSSYWRVVVAVLVVTWLTVVLETFLVHRELAPEAKRARRKLLATVLISPLAAIRAVDTMSRKLLADIHPLAMAAVLLSPQRYERVAAGVVRDAHFPAFPLVPDVVEPEGAATERFHRDASLRAIEAAVRRRGLDTETFLAPPLREVGRVRAYCPRCHGQYVRPDGRCKPCGWRDLLPLETDLVR